MPTSTSTPTNPPQVHRTALADHLRAVNASEHDPDSQAAATAKPLQGIVVALDQVVNRSQDSIRQHGHIHPADARANEGDLAEAKRQLKVLTIAANTGASMISAMQAQLTAAAAPAPTPAPEPPAPAPAKPAKK